MPAVRRTRPWKTKPGLSAQVNWSHPYAADLLALFTARERVGSSPILTPIPIAPTLTGTPTWTANQQGPTVTFDASNWYSYATPVGMNLATRSLTAMWTGQLGTSTRTDYFGQWGSTTSTRSWLMTANIAGTGLLSNYIADGSSGLQPAVTSVAIASQSLHTIIGTWNFSTKVSTIYMDGSLIATSSAVAGALATASGFPLTLGNSTGSLSASHSCYAAAVWNGLMSPAMIYQLGSDPNAIFQIFQPEQGPWLMPSVGGFQPWIYGDQIQEMYG